MATAAQEAGSRTNVVGDFAGQAAGLAVRLLYTLVCLLFALLQELTARTVKLVHSLGNRASESLQEVPKVKAFEMSACDRLHEDHFDDRELRLLFVTLEGDVSEADDALTAVVGELSACAFGKVTFSLQASTPPRLALLGTSAVVRSTGDALRFHVPLPLTVQETYPDLRFLINVKLRASWEMPQDDDLADAAQRSEWCDLGETAAKEAASLALANAQKVLRSRLHALQPSEDVFVFVDDSDQGPAALQVAGALCPEAWAAATKLLLNCEAAGVYLSSMFGITLWPSSDHSRALKEQLHLAVSASESTSAALVPSTRQALTLQQADLDCFDVLAMNIGAVIRDETPPGWHRLEWTPNEDDAVSHLTY